MIIGERIKEILFSKERSAMWLSEQLHCERTNVYDIFKRKDIGVDLLRKISLILEHDFFRDLSEYTFPQRTNKQRKTE